MCQKLVALTGSVWHTVNLLKLLKKQNSAQTVNVLWKNSISIKKPFVKEFFLGGLSQATVPDSNQSVLLPLLWPTRVDGLNFSYIFEKTQFFRRKKNPCNCLKDILPKDSYFKDSYTFFEHVWKNWWFSVLKTFLWLPRSQFLLISYTCGITLQLFMLANKLLIFLINLNSLQI